MKSTTRLLAVLALAGLAATACSDDGDSNDEPTDGDAAPAAVEVAGIDYAFEGLSETIAAGTELRFRNDSDTEFHEMIVFRIADGEERSVDELLQLPEEEVGQVTEMVGVSVAFPGEEGVVVEGGTVVDEPGRYAVLCFIPTGADPEAFREAMADPDAEGPPDVPGGAPHVMNGMVAEFTVEA